MLFILQYYNFTLFAMMLNELQDSQESILPPTDARLRPDIRKLEGGDIGKFALNIQWKDLFFWIHLQCFLVGVLNMAFLYGN